MRSIFWLLILTVLIAGACSGDEPSPSTTGPANLPAPTQSSVLPAVAGSAGAGPTVIPPASEPSLTIPAASATPTAAEALQTPATGIPEAPAPPRSGGGPVLPASIGTPGGGAGTTTTTAPVPSTAAEFTSRRLGISFQYLAQQNDQAIAAQEAGDKVYVYAKNGMAPTAGQYVQVYHKDPSQGLEDAIRQQVLQGYAAQECPVVRVQQPEPGLTWPSGYIFARIEIPRSDNDTPETLQAKAGKCPQPYAALGGIAYFLEDTQHPDKFVFLSIGQYYIAGPNGQPWQASLRFLDTGGAGGSAPTPRGGNALLNAGTVYLDDRSTPQSLMASYANALNRKEYLRAYSYWNAPAGTPNGPPPFDQFEQGFADTESVQVQFGTVGGDIGAGQLFYTVPTLFNVHTSGGGTQAFAGCYTLHLAQPGFQAAPPFQPLGIQSAVVRQVSDPAAGANLLGSVCQGAGIRSTSPGLQPTPTNPADISAERYLDNRSGPVEVLRSLFNAVNRHEYVRAYSYWEAPSGAGAGAGGPPPFSQFEQGYADTASVELITGEPQTGAGAGQIYYQVPATLRARQTNGATQTFVGCYTLHLSQPTVQGVPPFQPLSIASAKVRAMVQGADTATLMMEACRQ